MDKNYFKKYYQFEREHWWFLVRSEILEQTVTSKILPKLQQENLKILNIGVATGATTQMLKKFGEVTSLEYDADCCKFLREELGIEVINGSMTELPFEDNYFDLICAFDVIEHIEDDLQAISELYRTLKIDGFFFVTVPAFMSLWSAHDLINHHFRRYVKSELITKLKSQKFYIGYHTYFNSLLFPPIFIFRLISRFLKSNDGNNLKSDFENVQSSLISIILKAVFRFEKKLLANGIKFPFGVSLLVTGQKN